MGKQVRAIADKRYVVMTVECHDAELNRRSILPSVPDSDRWKKKGFSV